MPGAISATAKRLVANLESDDAVGARKRRRTSLSSAVGDEVEQIAPEDIDFEVSPMGVFAL